MQAPAPLTNEYIIDVPDDTINIIGGFVDARFLQQTSDQQGWTIKTELCNTLSGTIARSLVQNGKIPDLTRAPQMSSACAFRNENTLVMGTGFLVHPDMIIATAGHVVFARPLSTNPSADLRQNYKFVFGLTEKYTKSTSPPIPAARVWDIDRILFGQDEEFLDMTQDGMYSLDDIDVPDWALVRLKPVGGSVRPDPGTFLKLYDAAPLPEGPTDIYTIGHTWGTSLKLARPPSTAQAKLRNKVSTIDQSSGRWKPRPGGPPKEYPLVNVFRHNLRTAPGNSGGPVVYRSPTEGSRVLGIHSSGKSGEGSLALNLLAWNSAQPGAMIEPYFPADNVFFYSNLTKTDIWASLITPRPQLIVVARVIDEMLNKDTARGGQVSVQLQFTGPNGVNKPLLTLGPANGSYNSIRFDYRVPDAYLACELTAATVNYVPPTGPAQKQIVLIEALEVISRKPDDENNLNWTPLLFFTGAPKSMTAFNGQIVPVTFNTEPYVPKKATQDMVVGTNAVPAQSSWTNTWVPGRMN